MKRYLLVFVLAGSVAAFGQGRSGGGRPAGAGSQGTGMGHPSDMGRPSDMGHPSDAGRRPDMGGRHSDMDHHGAQQSLKESQLNGGAWKMLERKTNKSSEELQAMYKASGAKNYGQFVSAVVVSKNLGLDTTQVLDGLKTKSLGQTLQDMGVPSDKAKAEIKKAKKEVDAAQRS